MSDDVHLISSLEALAAILSAVVLCDDMPGWEGRQAGRQAGPGMFFCERGLRRKKRDDKLMTGRTATAGALLSPSASFGLIYVCLSRAMTQI